MRLPQDAAHGLELLEDRRPVNPDTFVAEVTPFIDYFRHSSGVIQQTIREQLDPKYFGRLNGYAANIAPRAVQNGSVEDIERGLTASALEGGRWDFRETVISLCMLYHSAQKLGVDVHGLFHKAAALGLKTSQDFLLGYLKEGDKRLKAMGFKEGMNKLGQFDYVGLES